MYIQQFIIKFFIFAYAVCSSFIVNCSSTPAAAPAPSASMHHAASSNVLSASATPHGGSSSLPGSQSQIDLKTAAHGSPHTHATPPATPSVAASASFLRVNKLTSQHGLDQATNQTLMTIAGLLNKFVSGEKTDTVPTICSALNKAAGAIEKPGTIGFSADEKTVEGIKAISGNLKAISDNINPRTCCSAAVLYTAATTCMSNYPWCTPCVVAGSVECLKPGTLKRTYNQTRLCCEEAQRRYQTGSLPFGKQKPQALAALRGDQSNQKKD